MSVTFLDHDEIAELTGRKIKSKQIDILRKLALPFFVNATGHPVVAREAISTRAVPVAAPVKPKWVPKVLRAG